MIPMVDVDTIGAGGGSIAYVDARRHLPRRAALGRRRSRARPPTAAAAPSRPPPTPWSTSAGCCPETFLGGGMELDAAGRARGVRGRSGRALGHDRSRRRRWAPSRSSRHSMVQSIEENSVRKGYDPRDFALVAEGGAGPLFAAQIALEVGHAVRGRAALPGRHRGARACSPRTWSTSTCSTMYQRLSALDAAALAGAFEELEAAGARASSRRTASPPRPIADPARRRLPLPRPGLRAARRRRLRRDRRRLGREGRAADFHDIHEREYSRRFEDSDIEIPNIRVRGIGLMPPLRDAGGRAGRRRRRTRRCATSATPGSASAASSSRCRRGSTTARRCKAGNRLEGPAIVNQYDSTTVIPPGLTAHVDRFGNIVIAIAGSRRREAPQASRPLAEVSEHERRRVRGRPPARAADAGSASRSTRSRCACSAAPSTRSPRRWRACSSGCRYSSIIRESEDLGAGHLRRRGPRALRVGLDADAHRLAALVHPRLPASGWRARSRTAT